MWPEDNKQAILYPYNFAQLPLLTMYIRSFICCNMFLNVVVSTVPLRWQGLRKYLDPAKVFLIGIPSLFPVRINPRNTEEQSQCLYDKGAISLPDNKLLLLDTVLSHLFNFFNLVP